MTTQSAVETVIMIECSMCKSSKPLADDKSMTNDIYNYSVVELMVFLMVFVFVWLFTHQPTRAIHATIIRLETD